MIRYINRSSNPHAYGASLVKGEPLSIQKCFAVGLVTACLTFLGCLAIMSISHDNWLLDLDVQTKDVDSKVRIQKTKLVQ